MQETISQWIFLFSELGLECAPGGHEVYYSNFFYKKPFVNDSVLESALVRLYYLKQ